jgi:hypothetical protein
MSEKFEVSFNSPQCGWMSVGFANQENEFSSTTAYTPHSDALQDILRGLTSLITATTAKDEFTIHWSRNPEAFDFLFKRIDKDLEFKVIEYPTFNRLESESETVFTHTGDVKEFCQAFYETFQQLYEARETDEFEQNWRQPFPYQEFTELTQQLKK